MTFLDNDWGRGTACTLAMGLLLAWPPSISFVLAAILLHQARFYFTRAFGAMERPDVQVPAVRDGGLPAARRP